MRTITGKLMGADGRDGGARTRLRDIAPVVLGLALVLATSATATAAPPPIGGLTALAGQAGCVTAIGGISTITVTAVATAHGHRSAARQLSFLVAGRT